MSDSDKMDVVPGGEDEKGIGAHALPWVEKYRPKSMDELIAHEDIINILNKLIENNKLPHLLFHGPPGTGMRFIIHCHFILITTTCSSCT